MNKLLILISVVSLGLTGCLKDKPNVDFSDLKPVVEIATASTVGTPNTLAGGLENFGSATLNFKVQDSTTSFDVNLASVNPLSSDLSVTVGVNDAARTAYNAANAGGTQFDAMPDSVYNFSVKTQTIKAGTRLAHFTIHFFPSKIDPSKSYMLPITITNASGQTISGNFNTIYFHIIGNPLAGSYTWNFTRYNGDTTVTPNSSSFTGHTAAPVSMSPTDLLFPDSYLTTFVGSTAGVTISFDNNGGVFSNFRASFDANTTAGLAAGGFTIAQSPVLLSYQLNGNAANGYAGTIFKTYFRLINSSGGTRSLVDYYVKN